MSKPIWTQLAQETRQNAGARALIKRCYRRWRKKGNAPHGLPAGDLEAWARANPMALLFSLKSKVSASKRAYVRGNDSRDAATLREETLRERNHAEDHDAVCALLGIVVDWPGLHPSYTVNGKGYHCTNSALKAVSE